MIGSSSAFFLTQSFLFLSSFFSDCYPSIYLSIYLISATKKNNNIFVSTNCFVFLLPISCQLSCFLLLVFLVIRVVCFVRCDSVWSIFIHSPCLFVCYVSYTTWFLMFDCFCCCYYWCGFFLTDDNTHRQTNQNNNQNHRVFTILISGKQKCNKILSSINQSILFNILLFCYYYCVKQINLIIIHIINKTANKID